MPGPDQVDGGLRMARDARAPGPIVAGFSAAGFRVGESVYPALLLTVDRAEAWSPPSLDELTEGALAFALDPAPEFLLLGTGATLSPPPRALVRALEARGIGVGAMDSRAAARAWGVLRSEGREIAGALYPLR